MAGPRNFKSSGSHVKASKINFDKFYLIRYLRGVVHVPQTPTQVTRPGCPQTRCSCVTSGSRGTPTCISRRLPSPRGPGPGRAAKSKTCTFLATAPCPARSHTCRCPSSVYIFTLFCRKFMLLKQNLKEDAECWQCAWPGSVTPHVVNLRWESAGLCCPHYLGLKRPRPEGCLLGHRGGRGPAVFELSSSSVFTWLAAPGGAPTGVAVL